LSKSKPTSSVASVRKASRKDVKSLSRVLRDSDLAEIAAYTGRSPEVELAYPLGVPGAHTFAIVAANLEVIGMFGVVPGRQAFIGRPWLMGSEELFRSHTFQFIRECRKWLTDLQGSYLLLENCVAASNKRHIDWIRWAGFELVEYLPRHGVKRVPFWKFQKWANKETCHSPPSNAFSSP